MKHFSRNNHKGFVILFTILISAIILLIGFGIFSIASRETVLSSTSREAQAAFYAADAGMECALYAQLSNALIAGGGPLDCGGIPITVSGSGDPLTPFVFDMLVDADAKTCAHVTVFDIGTLTGAARRVLSQGYNICTPQGLPAKNPILVERLLDTTYMFGGAITATPTASGPGKTELDPDFVPGGGGVLNLPNGPLSAPASSSTKPQ